MKNFFWGVIQLSMANDLPECGGGGNLAVQQSSREVVIHEGVKPTLARVWYNEAAPHAARKEEGTVWEKKLGLQPSEGKKRKKRKN